MCGASKRLSDASKRASGWPSGPFRSDSRLMWSPVARLFHRKFRRSIRQFNPRKQPYFLWQFFDLSFGCLSVCLCLCEGEDGREMGHFLYFCTAYFCTHDATLHLTIDRHGNWFLLACIFRLPTHFTQWPWSIVHVNSSRSINQAAKRQSYNNKMANQNH